MENEAEYRQQIIEIGKRIYNKGFVASNDGNLSIRVDNEVLITPTGLSLGFLSPDQLVKVNTSGEKVDGYLKPSSEIKFHLKVYQMRPDVRAVVHAHPPFSTGFAVAGISLNQPILPEMVISLGCVPIADYGTPGTEELVSEIGKIIPTCNAILLANHGVLTLGEDIFSAYYKMETVEHSAHINWVAYTLGKVNVISGEDLDKLVELQHQAAGGRPVCQVCGLELPGSSNGDSNGSNITENNDNLVELISQITANVLNEVQD